MPLLSQTVAVKSETDDTFTIAGWAVVFDTDEGDGADLEAEYFTKASDLWLDKTSNTKPLLYGHGANKAIGKRVIGRATLDPQDEGVWFEAEIEKAGRYSKSIRDLVMAGVLGASVGSVPHLVERQPVAGKSWLKAFPAFELSLSPTPIEPRTIGVEAIKALADLDESLPVDEDADTSTQTEIIEPSADSTPALKAAVGAAVPQIEAAEPATESTTVDQETKAADAVVASPVVDLNTNPDTTSTSAEVKSLKATLDAFIAKLNDEPAVKAGGVAIPSAFSGLKADADSEVKAFESYIRGGSARGMRRSEWANKAALNETTASQGGYAVPVVYSNDLIVPLTNLSYLRSAGARIINFSGTDAVHVPSLTYTAAAVATSEASPYSELEPTMGEVVFQPFKYTRLAKVSEELASDSRFDLWGQILMPDWAQAYAQTENTQFTTGVGTTAPQGIVTGTTTTGVTAAATGAITADELIGLYFALDFKYRPNAKWMMNDATIQACRQLKDGQSRYLWSPGLDGSTQGQLLGKDIITNNSVATMSASAASVLFGDFSYFWIAQWPGLDVQVLRELYSASGQIGYRSYKRFDSHVMLPAAFVKLVMHA